MQKLADICIRRPVFAAMIILALVVVGAASYGRLGVDRFPSVDLPTVSVRTTLPGSSPEEIESEVSQVIEEAVNTVEGIDELRSISSGNTSFVIATFNLNRDIDTAAQDVRDRVAGVIRKLPLDVQPPVVSKFNNDSSPVMSIALSGNRSLRELTEHADKVVKIQLERSPGVGEVRPRRRPRSGRSTSGSTPTGWPPTASRSPRCARRWCGRTPRRRAATSPPARASRRCAPWAASQTSQEFNDLVVATLNGQPVRVRDLGSAEDGTKEQRSLARLNGVPTVSLDVLRQSGANTVAVIEGVKEALARVQAQLPPDVKLEVIRDQSHYIYAALHEINLHLILGSILASPGGARLHAELALDGDRRRRHPDLGDRHLRHDEGARLHAQQRHHAGPGADGRRRDRRRHRRAREHLPLRRGEEDEPLRGGAGGDRGDRPARCWRPRCRWW